MLSCSRTSQETTKVSVSVILLAVFLLAGETLGQTDEDNGMYKKIYIIIPKLFVNVCYEENRQYFHLISPTNLSTISVNSNITLTEICFCDSLLQMFYLTPGRWKCLVCNAVVLKYALLNKSDLGFPEI